MPKRVATPPPGDDEPKYLSVVQPFPLAANWDVPSDRMEFARWIACCIGAEPFYAFFYRPRATMHMVILEVERTYKHFDGILGEHRWSEFLKDPSAEEIDRVTRVFHCLHKSGREVQKDGWRRINVEDAWFKDWSPRDWRVVVPYPPTHWCHVPREDRTNKQLCRPLPVLSFPPPKKPAPPVVGSAEWVNTKSAPYNSTLKAQRSAPGKKPRGNKFQPTAKKSATLSSGMPSSSTSTRSVPTSFVWANPTSPIPMEYPSLASSSHPPAFPPGLGPKPRQPMKSAWGPVNPQTSHTDYPVPPGLGITPKVNNNDPGPSNLASNPSLNLNSHGEVPVYLENAMFGMELESIPGSEYIAPWEQARAGAEAQWEQAGAGAEVQWEQGGPEATGSLWGDYGAPPRDPGPVLCNVHGVVCKKGICMEYDKQMKAIGGTKGNRGKWRTKNNWRNKGRKYSNSGDSQSSTWDGTSSWGSDAEFVTQVNKKQDDSASVSGGSKEKGKGKEVRAASPSGGSQAGSVAQSSNDGWDDGSVGPW